MEEEEEVGACGPADCFSRGTVWPEATFSDVYSSLGRVDSTEPEGSNRKPGGVVPKVRSSGSKKKKRPQKIFIELSVKLGNRSWRGTTRYHLAKLGKTR